MKRDRNRNEMRKHKTKKGTSDTRKRLNKNKMRKQREG